MQPLAGISLQIDLRHRLLQMRLQLDIAGRQAARRAAARAQSVAVDHHAAGGFGDAAMQIRIDIDVPLRLQRRPPRMQQRCGQIVHRCTQVQYRSQTTLHLPDAVAHSQVQCVDAQAIAE